MSRKRPVARTPGLPAHGDRPDVAARIAWTYLAALIAFGVAMVVVVIVNAVVAGAGCRLPDENDALACRLGWDIIAALAAFLLVFGAVARPLKLDVWVWVALVAGMVGYLAAAILGGLPPGEWWTWAGLLLIPAIAAAASAPWWPKPPGRVAHRVVLAVLAVGAVVAAVYAVFGG